MTIRELQKKVHENAMNKGFWDTPHNFGNDLMLIVSELGECIEAHRCGDFTDMEAFNELMVNETYDFETCFKREIKDSVEDELADALIRILDTAEGYSIDLQKHIELKMEYNAKRQRLHGKKY